MGDSVPAILIAFLMFFLPANPRNPSGRPILEWKTAQAKFPWGIIILVGGGQALADAILVILKFISNTIICVKNDKYLVLSSLSENITSILSDTIIMFAGKL